MNKIVISIDCYGCGNKLELLYISREGHFDYVYCLSCQEGIQLSYNKGILSIDRMKTE